VSEPLLEARALCRSYRTAGGRVRALRGVDLAIAAGETLGLVGESGCGKSTLARVLLRLEELDSGSVRFAGREVSAAGGRGLRAFRREAQLVFQDPVASLDPRQRVLAIVGEPIAVHRLARSRAARRARVAGLLEQVGLPAAALERYPHELSGGQRQRVGIARALAVEPRLLVADEPVSALDLGVQAQIVNLLLELQRRRGLSLLFISHDLRLVLRIARRVAVMYLGRIVEEAAAGELAAGARHPYTRALLAATPTLAGGAASTLGGEPPSALAPPAGCAFHPRCPLYARLQGAACRERDPTLSEVSPTHRVACHELKALASE
jgi:oligopeptide/dipeptide ABC transporter ATP-binding protein